jgi:hypothetical protein
MNTDTGTEQRYTDGRAWMMGLDEPARDFIEAIPEERRAWWTRIFVAAPAVPASDELAPPPAYLSLIFLKGERYVSHAVTEEFLRRVHRPVARVIEEQARRACEPPVVDDPAR